MRVRAARIQQIPSPPIPVSIARRLACLQLIALPADERFHYLAGSADLTDRGLEEIERRFLFCAADLCFGLLHDWAHGPLPSSIAAGHDTTREATHVLVCPECGAANAVTVATGSYGYDEVRARDLVRVSGAAERQYRTGAGT